ncbi:MAG: rRNA maturation RNase YbeY [Planctomycetota bacterium]|nr:rRNA maturation RNase YbeY [Planctomycetota bacterium]
MSLRPGIEVAFQTDSCPVDAAEVARAVDAALEHGGRGGLAVSVVLADDVLMVELHGDHLDDPTPTDVITFDLGEDNQPGGGAAAELFVGVEEARRVAEARGVRWQRELVLYIVHGVLHLCGFDDHTDADSALMRTAERAVMDALDYESDDAPHHM